MCRIGQVTKGSSQWALSYRPAVPSDTLTLRTSSDQRCRLSASRAPGTGARPRRGSSSNMPRGVVKANAWGAFGMLASRHEQPVPIFQQLARGHPSGRDDVREIPIVAGQRRGSPGRARDRHQPRDLRFWWIRFGPMFAAEIRKRRVAHMRSYPQWRWHLDEVFVKMNGKLCYLCAPSITKARCWKRWSPRGATRAQR